MKQLNEKGHITVAVGSVNPVKVQAVKNALVDEGVAVIPYAAASNVASQPLSEEETRQGAVQRARNCLLHTEASLAIGLEAGTFSLGEILYLCHWGALVDKYGVTIVSNGPVIMLPSVYKTELQKGKNLEDIIHAATQVASLGKKEGAIGMFTCNRLNREQVLTHVVKALFGQYQFASVTKVHL